MTSKREDIHVLLSSWDQGCKAKLYPPACKHTEAQDSREMPAASRKKPQASRSLPLTPPSSLSSSWEVKEPSNCHKTVLSCTFYKQLSHFTSPPWTCEGSSFPTSLPVLGGTYKRTKMWQKPGGLG